MRVLYTTCELSPWVKTGGLADVNAALPHALAAQGVDVRLLLPGLPALHAGIDGLRRVAEMRTPFAPVQILRGEAAGVPVYLIMAPTLFDRPGTPYQTPDGHDWPDNHRRFALLCWVAAHFRDGDWRADVVHGHDWHAGLTPAYLQSVARNRPRSVATIHNLAFQGNYPAHLLGELALPAAMFAPDGVEFHGQVSFMKAAIFYSDRVTTVSPRYAWEIQTSDGGFGLDGVLRLRQPIGILNGVDYALWNPQTDSVIAEPYGPRSLGRKAATKEALQQTFGLTLRPDAPLFATVSRVTWQKGLDLIIEALPDLIGAGAQFVLLGAGEPSIEATYRAAAEHFSGEVAFTNAYDERLSHLVVAGADVFTVPSRFEPCGLTQLYALRYGSVPLVRRVGGLADSVVDATPAAVRDGIATGFVFDNATGGDFMAAARRAITCYADQTAWRKLQRQGMKQNFSWHVAAERYVALYRGLLPAGEVSVGVTPARHLSLQPNIP